MNISGPGSASFLWYDWTCSSRFNFHSCPVPIAIPTKPNGGNHTVLFTEAAITQAAHDASIRIAKALAHTGFRVLDDNEFYNNVRSPFLLLE